MFKNRLFWKIFISYVALLSLCLIMTGFLVGKTIKRYHMSILTDNSKLDPTVTGHLILYIFLTFIVTLVIGFIIIRISTSPLLNITQIAKNFARGNFARKVKITSSGEISDLADAINEMGVELQTRKQTILDDKVKLDAIMANMNDAIVTIDLHEKIILTNNAARDIFGMQKLTLNRNYLWEKIRNEKLRHLVREIINTQTAKISEIEITSPGKKLLQAHLSPIQIDKNTRGILIVFHDITELRKLENTRREFVANVSHELRTPLASIMGYTETLWNNNTIDPVHSREFLGIIKKHAQRLDNLIKDVLELSKLESHDLNIELNSIDINPCMNNISSNYKEHCSGKSQLFEFNVPDALPKIETNEYLLTQLLNNLLDNAIKYTPKGGKIVLKIAPINKSIQFEISDTGIGIPQEHIPRIFERFYRVDPARSREMGGTGLGLSIVKHIVNLHHGNIKVESTIGVGSKFIIILPLQQPKYTI
ncbi:MAG TPA: two-component system histidine kinase PnpS [Candidatus Wujingus californicus]|uniref:two-component system histidine kinase PnpS n=1 Tax=Candidatus Wujingus californicus TaxID=3367618 RepID=UPI0040271F53